MSIYLVVIDSKMIAQAQTRMRRVVVAAEWIIDVCIT